jgi:hypothetical protein
MNKTPYTYYIAGAAGVALLYMAYKRYYHHPTTQHYQRMGVTDTR